MKFIVLLVSLALAVGCAKKESSSSGSGDTPAPQGENPKPGPNEPKPPAPAPTPAPPPPEVDPSQVTAIRATSWANVKYAFCSAQGSYGVLVDFQGTDLSVSKNGNFSFGVRGCSGTKPFKWTKVSAFTGVLNQKVITFDFGTLLMPPNCYGCSRDRIEVSEQLGTYTQGYGVLGGNSGPCVFLQNKATGGAISSGSGFGCQ